MLQGEESRKKTRATLDTTVHDRSALASNIATNQTVNSGVGNGRGRGHGRGANRGGRTGVGRGCGGTDRDKLSYAHWGRYRHTRENCWNLVARNQNTSAVPTESEKNINFGDPEKANTEVESQNWQNELAILHQRLAALEGASQTSAVGMVSSSSRNPSAMASTSSSSAWVIDSGATDHVTRMRSEFHTYTQKHLGESKLQMELHSNNRERIH